MNTKTRTYYGINIYPATGGGLIGARWEAYAGRPLMADTLEGIKELIRHYGAQTGEITLRRRRAA